MDRFAALKLPLEIVSDPRLGDGKLLVRSQIEVAGHGSVTVEIAYPDSFPFRRYELRAPELQLARHQGFDGTLCVFPRDPSHWQPSILAADTLYERVPRLVALVEVGGDALRLAEDPQGEPLVTYYPTAVEGGVVLDQRVRSLGEPPSREGTLLLQLTRPDADWLTPLPNPLPDDYVWQVGGGLLAQIYDDQGAPLLPPPPESLSRRYTSSIDGRWVWLDTPPRTVDVGTLWDTALSVSNAAQRWARERDVVQFLAIATVDEATQGHFEPVWVLLARSSKVSQPGRAARRSGNPALRSGSNRTFSEPVHVRSLRYGDEELAIRAPGLEPLRAKEIAIFGLGALGAPYAQELAKARVGSLHLVDHDFVDPGTFVRYPLGLESAGVSKTLALASMLNQHGCETKLTCSNLRLGATPDPASTISEAEAVAKILAGTDLMVSALAEDDINRWLDDFARSAGVPRLYQWSQSGYGGVVALLSEETGCYHCLALMLSSAAARGEPLVTVPPDTAEVVAGMVQSPGCPDKTFSATHPDLLPISTLAAQLTFGFLCEPAGGISKLEGDVFVVQVRDVDGRPIPPVWKTFSLAPDPRCVLCSPG